MLCNLCHSSVNGFRHSTKFLFINYVTIITSRALLNQRENFLSVTNIQHFILPPNNIHHTITKLTMSLLRTLPTRALPLLRTRPFSTSPYVSRSVVEGTKDVIDAVNRSVGKGLKKGIETGGESIRSTARQKSFNYFPIGKPSTEHVQRPQQKQQSLRLA